MPRSGSFILGIKWKSQGLEILQAVDRSIRTINTTGAAKGILRLPHRWQRVVHDAGDYIEGQQNFETCIYFVSVVNE
jgi:2-keto-3-deoxy-L-rhamnonate aldolase RhmA